MNNRKRTALCLLGAALCVFMTFGAALALGRYPITPAALLACGSQVLWLWGAGFADGLSPDDGTKQILLIRQSRQPAAPEQEQDHNIGGTDHA